MVSDDKDGATYLQSVCGIKELQKALETATYDVKEVIRDAIIIKRWNASKKV